MLKGQESGVMYSDAHMIQFSMLMQNPDLPLRHRLMYHGQKSLNHLDRTVDIVLLEQRELLKCIIS